MTDHNNARFEWAKSVMEIKPNHKILEIGCGAGFAVELIAPLLSKGKILAIDQSKPMIDKAIKRNERFITAGKADFIKIALNDFSSENTFDKIFCFNVNVFWTKKSVAQEMEVIKNCLSDNGDFYTFFGPLFAGGLKKISAPVKKNIENEGFRVPDVLYDKKTNCCGFIATRE